MSKFAVGLGLVLAILAGGGAAAQSSHRSAPQSAGSDVLNTLAAVWRPIAEAQLGSLPAAQIACAGAQDEAVAVEASLPPDLTPEGLAQIRPHRALIVVPADGAVGGAYFFPPSSMLWFASGFGSVTEISPSQGQVRASDAAGREIRLQLGRAGGVPVLRVEAPTGERLTFLGCMSLSPASSG